MRTRFFRNFFASLFFISAMVISSILPANAISFKSISKFSSTITKTSYATAAVRSQTQNDLPTPAWWSGTCDTNTYFAKTGISAYTLPLKNPTNPTNYRGVLACGPRPIADKGPDNKVFFFSGDKVGALEWECVELSMRYMYLAYGIDPYYGNGNQIVDNYKTYNINPILVPINNDGKSLASPQQGDILSYKSNHTSVVTANNVDSSGNGTITVMEQNFSSNGIATLKVGSNANLPSWVVAGVKNWLHHAIDLNPQMGSPSAQVQANGMGFAANEQITINFDATLLGTVTADSSGMFSTTLTIPPDAPIGTHYINFVGQTSKFSPQTVFYVDAPPTPSIQLSPTSGPPTTKVQVTGVAFGRSETVAVNFDGTQIGTASTDGNGNFSTAINIPGSALPGSHSIQAIGQTSGISAQATFLVQTDWSMFGFDTQGTHYNPYENVLNTTNVSSLTFDWNATTAGHFENNSSPVIANGIVYVGADDGTLYAFDTIKGSVLWTYPSGSRILSSPTVTNGVVYFGNDNGNLDALNAITGQLLWTITIPRDGIDGSPIVANGVVYIGSVFGNIYAFSAAKGKLLWTTRMSHYISSVPVVSNGVVYISFKLNGTLAALNAKTGTLLWTGTVAYGGTDGSPSVANGMVYTAAFSTVSPYDVTLYAFNALGCGNSTCSSLWTAPVGSPGGNGVSSPAVSNGIVYFGSREGTLYAFNDRTGSPLWTWTAPISSSFQYSSPAIANGVLYDAASPYSGTESSLYAFNATTGTSLWSYGLGNLNFTSSSIAVSDGMVYIDGFHNDSSTYGLVFAFHLPS